MAEAPTGRKPGHMTAEEREQLLAKVEGLMVEFGVTQAAQIGRLCGISRITALRYIGLVKLRQQARLSPEKRARAIAIELAKQERVERQAWTRYHKAESDNSRVGYLRTIQAAAERATKLLGAEPAKGVHLTGAVGVGVQVTSVSPEEFERTMRKLFADRGLDEELPPMPESGAPEASEVPPEFEPPPEE